MNPRLEHEALHTQLPGGCLEAGQDGPANPAAPVIGLDVHPLHLRSRQIEEADGATANRPMTVTRHEKGAAAIFEMFRLEVWPEALLGRIELGQGGVQRRDQSSRVVRVERFSGDGQAQIVQPLRTGCAQISVLTTRTSGPGGP